MNKKSGILIILIILVAGNAFAVDYPKPTSWVNDYASLLSSNQRQELDSMLKDFETVTTNQIFVCIMQNLPAGTTLEEYVNELFAQWQPGQKDKDNGALLAVFINDRKLRIEVGYGLEEKLTDAASKLIIANEIAPGFKQGNYYQGIKNGIGKMMLTIKGDYKLQSMIKPTEKPYSKTTPKTRSTSQSRRRTVSPTRTKTKPSTGPGIVIFIGIIGVFIVFIQIIRGVVGSNEGYSYSSSSGWKGSSKLFTKNISLGKSRSSGESQSSKRSEKRSSSSFSFSFGSSSSDSSSSVSFGSSSSKSRKSGSSSSFRSGSSSSGSRRRRSSSIGFSGGGGGSSGGGGASGSW